MDFDPRVTSDGHGWHCNFHFGYGQDIIDEDVENEKSCMQVLQLLSAKADDEIHDLEDELAILQCQLKWAKSDIQKDPCELFCAVFKRKIDSLTSAIESLRNENGLSGHHMDVRLELQRPAERICDITDGLIKPVFPEFDKEDRDLSNGKRQLAPSSTSNMDSGEPTAHLEAQDKVSNGEGNPKPDASQHEESEKRLTGSKTGDAATSPVAAEKEVTVKIELEEDTYDVKFQLDAYDSFTKTQNHEREDPFKDHWKASEDHFGIMRSRKKSSLTTILQRQEHKVWWKTQSNFGDVKPSLPALLSKASAKSEPPSDAETSPELGSTSKVQNRLHFPPEMCSQRVRKTEEDMILANPFQAKRNLQASKEGARIKCSKVKASGEMSSELPSHDLETLRLKLSEDPDYLARLRVQDLKEILRENKITGMTKFKKEKIIKELIKQLRPLKRNYRLDMYR